MVKINLACGQRKHEDFIGVDLIKTDATDIVADLEKYPWPFEPESVEEIYSHHYLEHIDGKARVAFMEECYRIMKPKAKMTLIVPYWTSSRSVQDPYHVFPPLCEQSFLYFNKQWRKDQMLDHYPITCDFDYGYGFFLDEGVESRNHDYQTYALKHLNNSALDLHVHLTKRE